MIRKLNIIIIFSMFSVLCSAQNVVQMWYDLPDSLSTYLSRAQRVELVDYYKMGGIPEVKNQLEGKSRIDTISKNFLQAQMSESLMIQMKMLPTEETNDSVLCFVRTFKGKVEESEVQLFDNKWNKITDIDLNIDGLIERPDTMSTERFEELKSFLVPSLVSGCLNPEDDILSIKRNITFANVDNREDLKRILVQKNLKWTGKTFN